ncbi:class I SAM-dependent methyltransferase [Thiocapsa imhoffii]|nr:methyltransferase domain-containing protein [Thiocapsa imhoffii]
MSDHEARRDALFMQQAIGHFWGGTATRDGPRVLDLGCGQGQLVAALRERGFDAWGCDAEFAGSGSPLPQSPWLRPIALNPYRLPFEDRAFDVVLSLSVLEHVQDKSACLVEIKRILRPGGCALHLFPAKWYLPWEPHLKVPLANYFSPRSPRWWLAIWARLGLRLAHQRAWSWRAVVDENARYEREGLAYWSTGDYRALSQRVFGHCEWPMDWYITHADGGFARLARRLPGRWLFGWLSREFRMAFLLHRRAEDAATALLDEPIPDPPSRGAR